MRPILSASGSYNFLLAKRLNEHLKPIASNEYMVNDTFEFVKKLLGQSVSSSDVLTSFDVTSLFTNVPLSETIDYLVEKAFTDNWFNATHDLNLTKDQLKTMLQLATQDQLFLFNGVLYEQFEGVAMGSPLGPLMANAFMCKVEHHLHTTAGLPRLYHRYVDDTFAIFSSHQESQRFLDTLNSIHNSLSFTCEFADNDVLPFIGINIQKDNDDFHTSVHRKATNTGLLLHYASHVDNKYKRSLVRTMITRAYNISSSWKAFHKECEHLKQIFAKLEYPPTLISSTAREIVTDRVSAPQPREPRQEPDVCLVLPFKSARECQRLRTQLDALKCRSGYNVSPVFTSTKLQQHLAAPEPKDPLVSRACVVYEYTCACDKRYIGFTARHLHERIAEHQRTTSYICKHCASNTCNYSENNFRVIAKCKTKLECRVREAIEIYFRKPALNAKGEFICSALFRTHY